MITRTSTSATQLGVDTRRRDCGGVLLRGVLLLQKPPRRGVLADDASLGRRGSRRLTRESILRRRARALGRALRREKEAVATIPRLGTVMFSGKRVTGSRQIRSRRPTAEPARTPLRARRPPDGVQTPSGNAAPTPRTHAARVYENHPRAPRRLVRDVARRSAEARARGALRAQSARHRPGARGERPRRTRRARHRPRAWRRADAHTPRAARAPPPPSRARRARTPVAPPRRCPARSACTPGCPRATAARFLKQVHGKRRGRRGRRQRRRQRRPGLAARPNGVGPGGSSVLGENPDRDGVVVREVRGERHALRLPVRVVREVRQRADGLEGVRRRGRSPSS